MLVNAKFTDNTSVLGIDTTNGDSTYGGSIGLVQDLALTKLGPNTLTLTGSNTYTGVTTVSGGTLQVGNGGSGASIGGTSVVNMANNAALIFNHTDSIAFAAPINGSGSLAKMGSGTLTLSKLSTYAGSTVITGGTLKIGRGELVVIHWRRQSDLSVGCLHASNYTLTNGYVTQLNDLSPSGTNSFTNPSSTVTVANNVPGFNGHSVLNFSFDPNATLTLSNPSSPQTVFMVEQVKSSHSGRRHIR